jgi:hypothetical protein
MLFQIRNPQFAIRNYFSLRYASSPQALPFRLKKNFNPFFTLSEKILGEKKFPATLLLISPRVG